jgi:transposase InsO family protein
MTTTSGYAILFQMPKLDSLSNLLGTLFDLVLDALSLVRASLQPRCALAAENLFLRKQLTLYMERNLKPRRAKTAAKLTLVLLSRLFAWREALTIVKPDTLIRWHRRGFRLFWMWKLKPRGRPRLPAELQKLIETMADDNPTWGEERIAAELRLKLGIRISPRTVRRYMPDGIDPRRGGPSSQRWMTFVRNHAQGMLACDFFVTVTACFRALYVFVIMEVGTRRIAHFNVTAHPTASWTLQQFREVMTGEKPYRFLIHDRDSTYSSEFDSALQEMGLSILKTPFRAPQANAFCERLVGSIRRECLDFLIPLNERHLRRILKEWVAHYNRGRPHSSLGPGIPESSGGIPVLENSGHTIPCGQRVVGSAVLAGLHHEYRLEKIAA